jgi:hypothetical protein
MSVIHSLGNGIHLCDWGHACDVSLLTQHNIALAVSVGPSSLTPNITSLYEEKIQYEHILMNGVDNTVGPILIASISKVIPFLKERKNIVIFDNSRGNDGAALIAAAIYIWNLRNKGNYGENKITNKMLEYIADRYKSAKFDQKATMLLNTLEATLIDGFKFNT